LMRAMVSAGEYCDWIPAFAGMTEQVQQDAAGVRGVPEIPLLFGPPRLGDQWG
jgi:hypothetical protein